MSKDQRPTVLIIDDSPIDISFLFSTLSKTYSVLIANNGTMGLEAAEAKQPDVILLDVSMPELDGYQTCRQLKQNPKTQTIDVIFVSAHDTTEEKMSGYDAGGSDYIVKPASPDELLQKVRLAVENKKLRESILKDKDNAFSTAHSALTSAGELAVVIDFFRDLSVVSSVSELSNTIVHALEKFNLISTVKVSFSKGDVFTALQNPVSPLEKEILNRLVSDGKTLEYENRVGLSKGNISILAKNMPEDDVELHDRYRGYIATFAEAADRVINELEAEFNLSALLSEAQQAMVESSQQHSHYKTATHAIMDNVLMDIQKAFDDWGLTESQEKVLLQIVNKSTDEFLHYYEDSLKTDHKMKGILDKLCAL